MWAPPMLSSIAMAFTALLRRRIHLAGGACPHKPSEKRQEACPASPGAKSGALAVISRRLKRFPYALRVLFADLGHGLQKGLDDLR